MSVVNGTTGEGFEAVRDVFAKNFTDGLEIGASFAAYYNGLKVVDLWGGVADPNQGTAWAEDTIALVFSTTKGVTAMCANKLAQEGKLDLDAPVATYWPEFAAGGKEKMPVSYLLSHQAGLAWVGGELTAEEAFSWDPVVDLLAQQVPHWEPGSKHGYHATTYGWLVGEVVKRVTGMSVGTYFRRAIAEPLGVDFWIGLPEAEEDRVAWLIGGLADPALQEDAMKELVTQFLGPETELGRALFSPSYSLSAPDVWNSRAMRAAEVPAANGVGDARSLARMYAACIGDVDGIRIINDAQLRRATTQATTGPNTVLLGLDVQFGMGFMVRSELIPICGPRSFGHFGAGGSMGWADPDSGLAFGYVMNRMDMGLAGDVRSANLVNACIAAVS